MFGGYNYYAYLWVYQMKVGVGARKVPREYTPTYPIKSSPV
jgi:hypothetical protein